MTCSNTACEIYDILTREDGMPFYRIMQSVFTETLKFVCPTSVLQNTLRSPIAPPFPSDVA